MFWATKSLKSCYLLRYVPIRTFEKKLKWYPLHTYQYEQKKSKVEAEGDAQKMIQALNFAISKKATIFVLSLWNLVRITRIYS